LEDEGNVFRETLEPAFMEFSFGRDWNDPLHQDLCLQPAEEEGPVDSASGEEDLHPGPVRRRHFPPSEMKLSNTRNALRGRKPQVMALQSGRSIRKSTLAFRKDQLPTPEQPVGARNYGNDCYALSLLQLLGRIRLWREAFGIFAQQTQSYFPNLVRDVNKFLLGIETNTIIAIPTLAASLKGIQVVKHMLTE